MYFPIYNALSTLPGHVSALTSSRVPSMSFVYFIFIFIYLLTFFSFLEYSFHPHYVFFSIWYLVYTSWTCFCLHCLTHNVLPLSRAVINSLYNYYHSIYKFLTLHCSLIAKRLSTLNFQLLSVEYILADLILLS